MHERLATCSYLQRVGIQVDHCYCLCGKGDETLDHLFFGCDYTSRVWTELAAVCGIIRRPLQWNEENAYVFAQCTTNSGAQRRFRCMFVIVVYYIWKEMNQQRLQGKKSTMESVLKQCKVVLAWCGQQDMKLARGLLL